MYDPRGRRTCGCSTFSTTPPPFSGGIVAHLKALGDALAARGDRLLAAFPRERAWFAELGEAAGTIALPQIRRPLRSGFSSAFSRICREERVDLAHLHFSFALPFALACRPRRPDRPVLYHWHNPPRALQRPRPSPLAGALARFVDRRAIDAHVAVGSEIRELLCASRWTSPGKITLLPNACAPARSGAGDPGAALPPSSHRPGGDGLIGSIANFRAQKDHATLLRAFALVRATHPRARLLLVGDGPTRPAMRRLAAELGLGDAVEFPGFVEDTAAVYELLDVFALSSRYEGQGLVLLEAMAGGLAVVATDLPPIRETLGPELSLWLTPPGDAEAMARAIERLLGDPALRAEMGRAGRERASREFGVAAWCRSLLGLYDRMVERS